MENIWVFKVSFKMNFEHLWASSSIKGPTTLIKKIKKRVTLALGCRVQWLMR